MLWLTSAFLAGSTLTLLGAVCTTGSRARRRFGVALALSAIFPPWMMPAKYGLVRGVVALMAFVGAGRTSDLYRGDWSFWERVWHVVSVADTRKLTRAPRRLDGPRMIGGLAWLGLGLAAAFLLFTVVPSGRVAFWGARWGFGVLVVYGCIAAGYRFAEVAYAALGFVTAPLHVAPILARSVQEFWGERWARPVNLWLATTLFWPYARRRRPLLGALAAFSVSAGFHAYVVWVALGPTTGLVPAGSMFAYFVVQAAVLAGERWIGVRTWPSWAGHTWTVACMLATAPLFLEPAVRTLGL